MVICQNTEEKDKENLVSPVGALSDNYWISGKSEYDSFSLHNVQVDIAVPLMM